MAKSVEELGKQLDALQARVVAAEEENKKLRERAETAGTTAAGTAGRATAHLRKSERSRKSHQLASEDAAFRGQRRIGVHNKLKSHLPCLRD